MHAQRGIDSCLLLVPSHAAAPGGRHLRQPLARPPPRRAQQRQRVLSRAAMAAAAQEAAGPSSAGQQDAVVRFQSQGLTLVGNYVEAGGAGSGSNAALLCHGLASSRNKALLRDIARGLGERGVASLRFDFRGNGESEGAFKYGNHQEEAADIEAAAEWLRSRGHAVHAVLGHSKAVTSVMTYAASRQGTPCLVLLSGRFDARTGVTQRFGQDIFHRLLATPDGIELEWEGSGKGGKFRWTLTKEDMDERMSLNMPALCAEVREQAPAILIAHGTEDDTIPVAAADSFARQLPGARKLLIEGACHNFRERGAYEEVVREAVAFIAQTAA